KLGVAFGRNAQFFTYCIVDLQTKLDGFAWLQGRNDEWKDDTIFVAQCLAGLVGKEMWRGIEYGSGFQIFRARKIEMWRHPGIARVTPICFPPGLHFDLDACAQMRIAILVGPGDKSDCRTDVLVPR